MWKEIKKSSLEKEDFIKVLNNEISFLRIQNFLSKSELDSLNSFLKKDKLSSTIIILMSLLLPKLTTL